MLKQSQMPSGAKRDDTMAIQLTLRDLQILETIGTARYMVTPQIQALFWGESPVGKFGLQKACERRMRLLHKAGFVRRIEQPVKRGEGTKPYIYALDKKGAALLVSELGIEASELDWQPKSQEENYPFLAHLLATTDLRITFQKACKHAGLALVMWLDEKILRTEGMNDHVMLSGPHGEQLATAVIPDAVVMLAHGGRRGLFFIEIDMGTVTVEPRLWQRKGWTKKVQAYCAYVNTELYTNRYEDRPARILTITTGEKRLENLKVVTEKADGGSMFWFTTFAQALDPAQLLTQSIWHVAGDDTLHTLLS